MSNNGRTNFPRQRRHRMEVVIETTEPMTKAEVRKELLDLLGTSMGAQAAAIVVDGERRVKVQ